MQAPALRHPLRREPASPAVVYCFLGVVRLEHASIWAEGADRIVILRGRREEKLRGGDQGGARLGRGARLAWLTPEPMPDMSRRSAPPQRRQTPAPCKMIARPSITAFLQAGAVLVHS